MEIGSSDLHALLGIRFLFLFCCQQAPQDIPAKIFAQFLLSVTS